MTEALASLLGLKGETQHLQLPQMLARAAVVCIFMLALMRFAGRRFLAQRNPFDALLGFLLASMMARAIDGSAPLGGTMVIGAVVASFHRLITGWTSRSHRVGRWLKGEPITLVENGQLLRDAMRRHHISEHDLREDARLNANVDDLREIKLARLERSGEISVVREK